MWGECSLSKERVAAQQKKLASLQQPRSTYTDADGNALLIMMGTEDSTPATGKVGKAPNSDVYCEICKMKWDSSRIQQHIGAHLMTGNWGIGDSHIPAEKRPKYPCGICGVRSSVQFTTIPSSVEGCPVALDKVKGTWEAKHWCKHACVPHYSLGPAKNCTNGAPCTNVPLQCRKCPAKHPVVIWKYSMEQHWQDMHSGVEMDSETKKEIQLGENEVQWTKQLLNRKTVKK